jgi:hypothetical protein
METDPGIANGDHVSAYLGTEQHRLEVHKEASLLLFLEISRHCISF